MLMGGCCSDCAEDDARKATVAPLVAAAVLGPARPALSGLAEAEPLIWTPGAIRALIAEVDAGIMATATGATSTWTNGKLPAATWQQWRAFLNEWIKWRDSIGFFSTLSGATADTAKSYRARGQQWRGQLEAAGVTVSAPNSTADKPGDAPSWLKWTVGGAAAVGASLVLFRGLGVFGGKR
jgi:hypothetical protein